MEHAARKITGSSDGGNDAAQPAHVLSHGGGTVKGSGSLGHRYSTDKKKFGEREAKRGGG